MALKTFTLEEADAYVPQLEQLLAEMQAMRELMVAQAHALETVLEHAPGNGGSKAASEYLLLLQRFNAAYTTVREIGCELKDLNQGLVDFPSYRDGNLIYLCWKRGEPRIEYWHDLESGFAGRQKL
jgi:hypothetical protein